VCVCLCVCVLPKLCELNRFIMRGAQFSVGMTSGYCVCVCVCVCMGVRCV